MIAEVLAGVGAATGTVALALVALPRLRSLQLRRRCKWCGTTRGVRRGKTSGALACSACIDLCASMPINGGDDTWPKEEWA